MPGLFDVKEGEAMGLFFALLWLREQGFVQVVLKLDAKSVVDAVYGPRVDATKFEIFNSVSPSFLLVWSSFLYSSPFGN